MTRIDTVDQLDALPIGSIVIDGEGKPWERRDGGARGWVCLHEDQPMRHAARTIWWQVSGGGQVALLFVPGRDLVQEAKADAWDQCSRTAHLQDHEPYCAPNPYRDEAP